MVDLRQTLANTVVSTLPAATAALEGRMMTVKGTAGVRSISYICEQADDNSYHWVPTGDGGDVVV